MQALQWVLPQPRLLAVLASPSLLLLWDVRGGTGGQVVWKRELSATEVRSVGRVWDISLSIAGGTDGQTAGE